MKLAVHPAYEYFGIFFVMTIAGNFRNMHRETSNYFFIMIVVDFFSFFSTINVVMCHIVHSNLYISTRMLKTFNKLSSVKLNYNENIKFN